jgi:hypothetical protein
MWEKYCVKAGSPQMTKWRMCFTCWILDSHPEYEILISTATLVTRKRLVVTIHVQYVAYLLFSQRLNGTRHNSLRVRHIYLQISGMCNFVVWKIFKVMHTYVLLLCRWMQHVSYKRR